MTTNEESEPTEVMLVCAAVCKVPVKSPFIFPVTFPVKLPTKVVDVVTPVANISPSGLTVIPEPTITSPELLILTLSVLLASLV